MAGALVRDIAGTGGVLTTPVVRVGRIALRADRRGILVGVLAWIVALGVAVISVTTGTFETGGITEVLTGNDPVARFIVLDQRLPRALAALGAGALLAGSGAIFQTLTRNALGSPDLIGFTAGSASGGLVAIVFAGGTVLSVGAGALAGGAVMTVVVLGLTGRARLTPDLVVLVGIAVAALLGAVNDVLLTRAPIESAEAAKVWQFGSLNMAGWTAATPLVVLAAVLVLAAPFVQRPLRSLELGDDTSAALGTPVMRVRFALVSIGVLLVATVVAAVGPIGFVALAAPRIATWLARSPGISIMGSTATGACMVAAADLLGQRLLAPFQIPVGLVVAVAGGAYLLIALARRRA